MAQHLALHCPFAKEVWCNFQGSNPVATRIAASSGTVRGWWNKLRQRRSNERSKREISLSLYVVWHIWKERCRRIFDQEAASPQVVAGLIRSDIEELLLAKGRELA
jgi:hypothetical protein